MVINRKRKKSEFGFNLTITCLKGTPVLFASKRKLVECESIYVTISASKQLVQQKNCTLVCGRDLLGMLVGSLIILTFSVVLPNFCRHLTG